MTSETWLSPERLATILQALVILVMGYVLARLATTAVGRVAARRGSPQLVMMVRRITFYSLLLLVFASTLSQLGFKIGVVLGAAGLLTVAIGFASQTSVSNVISGIFLIAERHFEVGDIIRVDDVTGEVLSIDLLSVKLRTFDNLLVRLPNESLIKTRVTNLTKFPIRRNDLKIGVAYKEDMERVRRILFEVAELNPLCLDEPKPLFIFTGYGESSLDIQFSVWTKRENFIALANSIRQEIKEAFDRNGIEIPFPHRSLYTGSVTDPFPVRIVDGQGSSSS